MPSRWAESALTRNVRGVTNSLVEESRKQQRARRLSERVSAVVAAWRSNSEPKFTREQLASALGMSVSTVVRWESSKHSNPRFSEIWAMEALKPGLVDALFSVEQVEFAVPVRTVSEANVRSHWAERAKRTKGARGAAKLHTIAAVQKQLGKRVSPKDIFDRAEVDSSVEVHLRRLAPGQLDDDNLQGALKGFRDGVADAFARDDGDKRFCWVYSQSRAKTYGVEVVVRWRPKAS